MKALDTMTRCSRWLAPSVLAAALGMGFAMSAAPAQAQDDLARVLVDIADVAFQSGVPYYRYGHHGQYDRLVVQRDRYGRPVYYRYVPRGSPAYGNVHGRYEEPRHDAVKCNKHGKCKATYYDGRYDHDGGWWDGHRWHDD